MVRKILVLTCFAVVLAGCLGPSGPKGPGTGKPPTGPDDLFTGEPTQMVVRVTDSSIAAPMAMFTIAAEEVEEDAHFLVIGTPLYNEAGFAVNTRFTVMEVSETQQMATAGVEIAALQKHDVTTVRFKDGRLISFGRAVADTPVGMTTTVDVEIDGPSHTLHMADPLRGNREVRPQMSVDAHNPPGVPMVFGDVLLGLNPWNENGSKAMRNANPGAEEGFNTGVAHEFFPDVNEPTTLYYQVRLCVGAGYLPQPHRSQPQCVYVPDVEAGQPLDTVVLYPEHWAD